MEENKRVVEENKCTVEENKRLTKQMNDLGQSLDKRIADVVNARISSLKDQLTPSPTSSVSREELEARLVTHRATTIEECRRATRLEFSDAIKPLSEGLKGCVDKVDAVGATAEEYRKVAVSTQESLESQQKSIAHAQNGVDRLSSAFGEDPAACVQILIDNSVKLIQDRVTAMEAGVAETRERIDAHGATLDKHGGEIEGHNRRLDKHDGGFDILERQIGDIDVQNLIVKSIQDRVTAMEVGVAETSGRIDAHSATLDKYDGEIEGHNRRLDKHDGGFDSLKRQLGDVDARCDRYHEQTRDLRKQLESHDGRIQGVVGRVDHVNTRLDAHDGRFNTQGAQLDSLDMRLNAQVTRSGTQDMQLRAHDERFASQDARTDAHGKQLHKLRGQLNEYHDESTKNREEVARMQADLVDALKSLGEDEVHEVIIDNAFVGAFLPLRSRLGCCDKSMADLSAHFTKVDEALFEERGKRTCMQAKLDRLGDAFGDDPKATINAACSEAIQPLSAQLSHLEEMTGGAHDRLNKQDEILSTLRSDLTSARAMLDDFDSALGDDPVAAVKGTKDLLRDLAEKYAALSTRLDDRESLCDDDQQAIRGLRADISRMLKVFGNDPEATIRNAITEYIQSMESRIKYLEDKRSGLQDQADKKQAVIAVIQKDMSVTRADFARLTRAVGADPKAAVSLAATVKRLDDSVACQRDDLASLREGIAADREQVVRVERELGAFVKLFEERTQSLVVLPPNAHDSLRLEDTSEPILPASVASDQDIPTREGRTVDSDGEHDDSDPTSAIDEGLSPAVLPRSLRVDSLSELAGTSEDSTVPESLVLEETSTSTVAADLTLDEGRQTSGDTTVRVSTPPTEASEDATDDGCGLSSCVRDPILFLSETNIAIARRR